jgi:hypothetical protein
MAGMRAVGIRRMGLPGLSIQYGFSRENRYLIPAGGELARQLKREPRFSPGARIQSFALQEWMYLHDPKYGLGHIK